MAKVVRCRQLGVECDFEARGTTDEEVMATCAEHSRIAHGIHDLTPELLLLVIAAIREEPEGQAAGA